MNTKYMHDILLASLQSVLEDYLFIISEPAQTRHLPPDMMVSSLEIRSPKKAVMYLACPASFIEEAVDDVMGEFTEVTVSDTVGELLNMTSGLVLEKWLGEEVMYDIGTPQPASPAEFGSAPIQAFLESDEGHVVAIALRMEE